MMLYALAVIAIADVQVARTDGLVLKVVEREKVADAIVAKAESLEGYFTARSENALELRVPSAKLDELETYVESLGIVVDRSIATQDLGAQLENSRAIIAAREQLLQRYVEALAKSSADGVVTVEREATRLVQEIESAKGALHLAEHQLAFAKLVISFQIRDRSAPRRDGMSSFKWLNTVNLADLIEAFHAND